MNFQLTHPQALLLLPLALGWILWWFGKSDLQISPWRRWTALGLRLTVVLATVLAVAGLQWLRPIEGMNVFFLLDRSDSVPAHQQEAARHYVNQAAADKKTEDRVGVLVFGTEAAIESSAAQAVNLDSEKVLAVVGTERTDIAAAIRLGTAAFPETGQKRLVLVSDGNENLGDSLTAMLSARSLGVTLDVIPVGVARGHDVALQRLGLPARVKQGSAFEAKIFVETDRPQKATVRLYRNDQPLHEQEVTLTAGKNLFSFPQRLSEPGFYHYTAFLESEGDALPQNNKATGFIHVRGEPRLLAVSAKPTEDEPLIGALRSARLEVEHGGLDKLPTSLAELTSYDALFLCNISAGDLGRENMLLLESAVRDFGLGLVCVGGDQTYAAGGYRGTPLESTLPLNMELDSKKVLPNGAIVLIMHGMEFANGDQIARDCALGVLDSLGPQDELGVLLWDGRERWLFELTKVTNRKALGQKIAGMNQGDLGSFEGIMTEAYQALRKSTANLKHIVVFSDGDPARPSQPLLQQIVADRITVSTVLIAGHAGPDTMEWIAFHGRGRFYDVNNPNNLPQLFIKEAAVILKAAIFEEPFKPQLAAASEVVQGIPAEEYPTLYGYVSTTPKNRAEIPLLSQKGDPILAHWQYGLGRAVAFTSDAKARWARDWLGWDRYRQFWTQIAQWSLRRIDSAEFTTDLSVDQGQGHVLVEALDEKGDYRNFLHLQAAIVGPAGDQYTVRLKQTGPGRYESDFPTRAVGPYLLNIMELQDGRLVGAQVVGTSINYSPELSDPAPDLSLLRRLAESGAGRSLDPANRADNPFLHDRQRTFQPQDLWQQLLQIALLLFVLDIAIRRIQLEREQVQEGLAWAARTFLFWRGQPRVARSEESLATLLARRDQVRQQHLQPTGPADPNLFRPQQAPGPESQPVSSPASGKKAEPPPAEPPSAPEPPASTTSRLLEAKRRAKQRLDR